MEPVLSREIVASHGEFLYRKSSQADPDAVMLLAGICHRMLGTRGLLSDSHAFSAGLAENGWRLLFRHRNACVSYGAIILATRCRPSKVLRL